MNYTLEELEKLYDDYEIVFNSDKQPMYIEPKIKKSSSERYGSGELYDAVKMAYVWASVATETLDKSGKYMLEHRKIMDKIENYEKEESFGQRGKEIFNDIMEKELNYYDNGDFHHDIVRQCYMDNLSRDALGRLLSNKTTKDVFELYLKNASKVKVPEDYKDNNYSR